MDRGRCWRPLFERILMYLSRLKLIHFRNYEQLNVKFFPGINLLYGSNAQGKTNVLEAIHICGNGKSFRVNADSKTIMAGTTGAYLYAEYVTGSGTGNIEVLLEKDRKKSIKIDGIPVRNVKELLGNLYVVVFSPEDIKTAKEAPSLRRGFLDGEISKIRPSYVDALKNYTKIIAEKNAVLRRKEEKNKKTLLEAYNEQLSGYIRIILKNRKAYVKKLNEYVKKTHSEISGGREQIKITYKETIPEEEIKETLTRLISKEIAEFGCAAGPHRDDLDITINGKDVRIFASQGQLRTLMLAIKTACLRILEESTGEMPVLLLDDVFSELDAARKRNLLNTLRGIQVFITTADPEETPPAKGIHRFFVENGTIEEQKG